MHRTDRPWMHLLWFQLACSQSAFNFNPFDTESQYLMLNSGTESIIAYATSRYQAPRDTCQSL